MAFRFKQMHRLWCLFIYCQLALIASSISVVAFAQPNQAEEPMIARGRAPLPSRIVSFAPSNTELLFSLQAQDKLVGVCSHCNYPPQVAGCEKVGSFKVANLETLIRLKPDLVLLVGGQEQLQSLLQHHGYAVAMMSNEHLSDLPKNLRRLGDLTGTQPRARSLANTVEDSISQLRALVRKAHKPRLFLCIWPHPLLTVGKASFLNDIITVCGGINIAGNLKAAYPQFSAERLIMANPEVIILPHQATTLGLEKQAAWASLTAVREHRVFFLPDESDDRLARPSMRVLQGIQWLCTILHPELKQELDCWMSKQNTKAPTSNKIAS